MARAACGAREGDARMDLLGGACIGADAQEREAQPRDAAAAPEEFVLQEVEEFAGRELDGIEPGGGPIEDALEAQGRLHTHWLNGLEGASGGLIEAARQQQAKSRGETSAGKVDDVADGAQAHLAQRGERDGWESQASDVERTQEAFGIATGRCDDARGGRMRSGQGPGKSDRGRDADAMANAQRAQIEAQQREEAGLSSKEVLAAGDVEEEASVGVSIAGVVERIEPDDGRESQQPRGQGTQSASIGLGRVIDLERFGGECLGVGESHAGVHAARGSDGAAGGDDLSLTDGPDDEDGVGAPAPWPCVAFGMARHSVGSGRNRQGA